MSDTSGDQGGAFARAFLPGLVLGLVIGGVCGAILPTVLESRPKIDRSESADGTRTPRDGEEVDPGLDQAAIDAALEQAKQEGENLAGEAGELLEEGAERVEGALDDAEGAAGDLLDPPSDD